MPRTVPVMSLFINGEEIDEEIIEGEFRQIKGHYERTLQVSCCERDPEFRQTAKDNITARVLLNQEARSRFAQVAEEEVTERLQKLIEEAGGEQQFYVRIGMGFKDEGLVRENVANGVRLDKLLAEVYGNEQEPSEEDLRAYYARYIDSFKTEEHIRVIHITKSMDGASSRQEVYETMRGLRKRLLEDGVDFEAMAEAERGNEQQQIDLGWFKRGEFMEEFETIAFSMIKGEISPIFTTQLGFHLCKLMDRRSPEAVPFEEVQEKVKTKWLDDTRDQKFNAFLEQLKAKADVKDDDPDSSAGEGH
jgi:parvulin-like peptidyl-prolyl isomerase